MGSKVWCFEHPRIPSFDARCALCKFLALLSWNLDPWTEKVTTFAIFGRFKKKKVENDPEMKAVRSKKNPECFGVVLGGIFCDEAHIWVHKGTCCFSLKV